MHPSRAVFNEIRSLWKKHAIDELPAFFVLTYDQWERVHADDLEAFYESARRIGAQATALLTSYSVGDKTMLIAHYESPIDTCHQVWSIGEGNGLADAYRSPIQMTHSTPAGREAA
jgi:hypothetical protein